MTEYPGFPDGMYDDPAPDKSPAPARKALADDIPVDRAWIVGRRVFVRCGAKSQLDNQMRGLGARWDRAERALWTGTSKAKLAQVAAFVRDAQDRTAAAEATKALGLWVTIPRGAKTVRDQVKKLGGIFDSGRADRGEPPWALPDAASRDRALALIAEHTEQAKAARAVARKRAARDAAETLEERIGRLAAEAGRTVITDPAGRVETVHVADRIFTRMRRAAAEAEAYDPGEVFLESRRQDDGGRRLLVIYRKVEFWDQDAVDDFAPHLGDAHWCITYTGVLVENTPEESAADQRALAVEAEAREVHQLMESAAQATGARGVEDYPPIEDDRVVTISGRGGHLAAVDMGTLILTAGGVVHWRHGGHYDDYRRTAGSTSDTSVVERVRRLASSGTRTIRARDQLDSSYTVTVHNEEGESRG